MAVDGVEHGAGHQPGAATIEIGLVFGAGSEGPGAGYIDHGTDLCSAL